MDATRILMNEVPTPQTSETNEPSETIAISYSCCIWPKAVAVQWGRSYEPASIRFLNDSTGGSNNLFADLLNHWREFYEPRMRQGFSNVAVARQNALEDQHMPGASSRLQGAGLHQLHQRFPDGL